MATLYAEPLNVEALLAVALLSLHIIASVAVLQVLVSNVHAIRLRFAFLREFGDAHYPDIQTIGGRAFRETYGSPESWRAKYFRWGRCAGLWYLIPLGTAGGSLVLLILRISRLSPPVSG